MTDEPSPRPWKTVGTYRDIIVGADGVKVCELYGELGTQQKNASLIVSAVNERDRLCEELDSAKVKAESEKRWANDYFAQAQKAEAERDRLREEIERLRGALKRIIDATYDIDMGCPDFREIARAALGEGEKA